jgi:hypothetical protein
MARTIDVQPAASLPMELRSFVRYRLRAVPAARTHGAGRDRPELAAVEIHAPGGLNMAVRSRATEIADAWLADIAQATEVILDQQVAIYRSAAVRV